MLSVTRDDTGRTRHTVRVRAHSLAVDLGEKQGGEDAGPDPHDLFDAALGACKALTTLWYAQRHSIPLGDVEVTVERDGSEEPQGRYRLRTSLRLGGPLTDAQRADLLRVASKCPVHKLMTATSIAIETELAPAAEISR
jgi:putative redox protein